MNCSETACCYVNTEAFLPKLNPNQIFILKKKKNRSELKGSKSHLVEVHILDLLLLLLAQTTTKCFGSQFLHHKEI